MKTLLVALVALVLTAGAAGADPQWHGHGWGGHGWGWGGYHYRPDPGTAFWGGVIGGLAGSIFRPSEPDVVVVQPQRDVAWCLQRYRSYDTYTRTYLGFDGLRHGCP